MCLIFLHRRILLEKDADVTRKCRRGRTPLQEAPKGSLAAKLLVSFFIFIVFVLHVFSQPKMHFMVQLASTLVFPIFVVNNRKLGYQEAHFVI